MPKQKTKSSVTKRIKTRKSGSLKRSQAFTSHLFTNKSQKQKRKHRSSTTVSKGDARRYKDVM
jgi:large subunit ribosomal protein L35